MGTAIKYSKLKCQFKKKKSIYLTSTAQCILGPEGELEPIPAANGKITSLLY